MSEKPVVGSIGWLDLTVDDAESLRDFYRSVVGWKSSGVDMGGYEDFSMIRPSDDTAVAGVCHSKGVNTRIPPVWMVYVIVENLDESIAAVGEGGGTVVFGPKNMGESRYCIIRDPAGAHIGLFQNG